MNKFTKKAILVLTSICMVGIVAIVGSQGLGRQLFSIEAESPSYDILLDESNAASSLTDSFGTVASYSPSRFVDWTINRGKRAEGKHVQLEQSNGFLANILPINGVTSITAIFEGSLTLLASPNESGNIDGYSAVTELTSGVAYTHNMVSSMFAFASKSSSPIITSIKISYSCITFSTDPYVVEDGENKTSAQVKASYVGTWYNGGWVASGNGVAMTSKDVSSTGGSQSVFLRYSNNASAFRHTKALSFPEGSLYNAFSLQMKGNSVATDVTVRLNSTSTGAYADYKVTKASKAWTEHTIPFASSDWVLTYGGNPYTFTQALSLVGSHLEVSTIEQLVIKLFNQFEIIEKTAGESGAFHGIQIDNVQFLNVDVSSTSVTNLDALEGAYVAYMNNNLVEAVLNPDLTANIKVTQKTTVAYDIPGTWAYDENSNKVTITTAIGTYEANVDGYGRSLVYSSATGYIAELVTNLNLFKRRMLDDFNDADTTAIQNRWNVRYDSGSSGWQLATSPDRLVAEKTTVFEGNGSGKAKSWNGGKYGYRIIDLTGGAVFGNDIHGFSFRILNNSGVSFKTPKLFSYLWTTDNPQSVGVNKQVNIVSNGDWCEVSVTVDSAGHEASVGFQFYLEASDNTFYFYMDNVQIW